MIDECISYIRNIYKNDLAQIALEESQLDEGTYLVIKKENGNFNIAEKITVDKNFYKDDKKNTVIHYDFLQYANYHSKYLDSNKCIGGSNLKIIFSSNYYSFIFKKENLNAKEKDDYKLSLDKIDQYYNSFLNFEDYFNNKNQGYLYNKVLEDVGHIDNSTLELHKEFIKKLISDERDSSNYLNDVKDKSKVNFIFYYDDYEELYKKEYIRYIYPKISNNNKYNEITENTNNIIDIYGLSGFNYGLSDNKPYLKNKTRNKEVPKLINIDKIIDYKYFFDILTNYCNKNIHELYISEDGIYEYGNLYDGFSGIYIYMSKGKTGTIIENYDYIDNYANNLKKEIHINKYTDKIFKESKLNVDTINTISTMYMYFNEVFFEKRLSNNFYSDAKNIKASPTMKKNIILYRNALFDWFKKGNENSIKSIFDKMTKSLVVYSIENEWFQSANDRLNLRLSMLPYFDKGDDKMDKYNKIRINLDKKINDDTNISLESDTEYCFAVGQLVNFFESNSKSDNKNHSFINPFITCKNSKQINDKLRLLFKKYNYNISGKRFDNLYKMILGYELNNKVNFDDLICGYLSKNLIFKKNMEVIENE